MENLQEWINQNLWLVVSLALWELFWKGWALWIAARKASKPWFVVLLLVSSSGLLPIFYIFVASKETTARN